MAGPRFLLDTNVVIGLLAGRQPAVDLITQHDASPQSSAISQITRLELLCFPDLLPDEDAKVRALIEAVATLLIDDAVEQEAIRLRRRLRIKLPDAIIAATANIHGMVLLTLDERLIAALERAS